MSNYKELLRTVNTFIFDYDGVLTDGSVLLLESGEALRTANVKDGYAMQLANRSGALNDIEYSEFVIKAQAFADVLNGAPRFS